MIDILIPVLNRPHRVAPLLGSIAASTTVPHTVLFLTSPDDGAEVAAIVAAGARHLPVPWAPAGGDYARKINLGFAYTREVLAEEDNPFVFLGADDLEFRSGWDEQAIAELERAGAGVCGTQDGANPLVRRGAHSTHSLVRRAYIDECGGTWHDGPGVVYHEGYAHMYVDNELCAVAKERGCWAFAHQSRVLHHHPIFDRSVPMDATYTKAMDNHEVDRALYQARQRAAL